MAVGQEPGGTSLPEIKRTLHIGLAAVIWVMVIRE